MNLDVIRGESNLYYRSEDCNLEFMYILLWSKDTEWTNHKEDTYQVHNCLTKCWGARKIQGECEYSIS